MVIDNGTGYTKMGYAGNMEPSYLIPSCIAKAVPKVSIDVSALAAKKFDSSISRVLDTSEYLHGINSYRKEESGTGTI